MKKIYWRIVYDQRSDVAAYVCVKCGFQGPQVWQGTPKPSQGRNDLRAPLGCPE
jgi:hypothetical protein